MSESNTSAQYLGTKLSQNQHYGRPCAKKLKARILGWKLNNRTWWVFHQLHKEIENLRLVRLKSDKLDDLVPPAELTKETITSNNNV